MEGAFSSYIFLLQLIFQPLERLSGAITENLISSSNGTYTKPPEFLSAITDPFTDLIVRVSIDGSLLHRYR